MSRILNASVNNYGAVKSRSATPSQSRCSTPTSGVPALANYDAGIAHYDTGASSPTGTLCGLEAALISAAATASTTPLDDSRSRFYDKDADYQNNNNSNDGLLGRNDDGENSVSNFSAAPVSGTGSSGFFGSRKPDNSHTFDHAYGMPPDDPSTSNSNSSAFTGVSGDRNSGVTGSGNNNAGSGSGLAGSGAGLAASGAGVGGSEDRSSVGAGRVRRNSAEALEASTTDCVDEEEYKKPVSGVDMT